MTAIALLALSACGGQAGPSAPQASPTPAASPTAIESPSPVPTSSPTPTPAASPSVAPTQSPAPAFPPEGFGTSDVTGGNPAVGSGVVAVRVGSHPGYDRFVIEFSGLLPSYSVQLRQTPTFTRSPRGDEVTLLGSAGVNVKVFPVTNWSAYNGPTALTPGLPVIRQARLVENFEAVQQWGLGVTAPAAIRVMVLAAPTRLVVDVATP